MRVLVTGATGFVGQHLVPILVRRGHAVTAVARDRFKARQFESMDCVDFVECDIHDPGVGAFERFGRPQAIVHLAWPGLPNYKELFHFEENLPAAYAFLKGMIEAGVGHVLVTGTCAEYGMINGPLREDTPTAPANPYALAKDTLRKWLTALQASHDFGLQWARLFYMHGPGQSPRSLLAQLDRAIDDRAPVFNMTLGEQLRDYLPVQTVAERLAALLEQRQYSGVVNVCSGVPVSVRRLVEQHAAARGSDICFNIGHLPYSEIEPMAFWGDPGKLNSIIGEI